MKRILFGIMLLCSLCMNAQTITTKSSCDSNSDGKVDISDVTNTSNKVLAKTASETNVVTASDLNNVLTSIYSKLTSNSEELQVLRECISAIAEKVGAKTPEEIMYNGHKYVDLGLPSGLKWATCNVGATSPEDYGDYFAWGETTTKSNYDSSNYFDLSDDGLKYIKYNISGGKTTLALEDDAARVCWGGKWRIPTDAEQDELINNCTWTWTTQNNVNGYVVTGTNGNFIFLPAAGGRSGTALLGRGSIGRYSSSSIGSDDSKYESYLYFNSTNSILQLIVRTWGLPIRPVCN